MNTRSNFQFCYVVENNKSINIIVFFFFFFCVFKCSQFIVYVTSDPTMNVGGHKSWWRAITCSSTVEICRWGGRWFGYEHSNTVLCKHRLNFTVEGSRDHVPITRIEGSVEFLKDFQSGPYGPITNKIKRRVLKQWLVDTSCRQLVGVLKVTWH